MFSTLRTRYGIPGLIATVALVFAMTGGAFAAKYLITSTKQIKPSVLKKLKGATGPAGAAGAQGPAGAAGANGKDGAVGPTGPTGEKGEKGAKGATGEEGEPGEPWTVDGTLPSEATETGAWDATFTGEGVTSISFPIPLATALPEANVHVAPNANCPGTVADPQAAAGHLCVYVGAFSGAPGAVGGILVPGATPFSSPGAGKTGALIGLEAGGGTTAQGTFAVTAP
jgi:Rieske Fe-S protein